MKLLAVLFLAGLALAYNVPRSSHEEVNSVELSTVLEEKEMKDFQENKREEFQEVEQMIQNALENGKAFQEALEKLREARQKQKGLTVEICENARELIKNLKDKVGEYFHKSMQKFRVKREDIVNEVKDELKESREIIHNEDNFVDRVIDFIQRHILGRTPIGKQILDLLQRLGNYSKNAILKIIDKALGGEENKRSIKEVYERVDNFFKIDLKEKFRKFGEYLKKNYERALESGKDRIENFKKPAREFANDTKVINKDDVEQAEDCLRRYMDDLGVIYDDAKEKVRDILKRN